MTFRGGEPGPYTLDPVTVAAVLLNGVNGRDLLVPFAVFVLALGLAWRLYADVAGDD